MKIDRDILLKKMLSLGLSDREKDELNDYILSTYEDEELDELMRMHWEQLKQDDTAEGDNSLQHIKNKISILIAKQKVTSKRNTREDVSIKTYLVRAAAVLFLPLLLTSAYLFYQLHEKISIENQQVLNQQVFASPGSRVSFMLPDSTKVWLNSASSLEFALNMDKQKERRVKLIGQGYFEVSKDKQHPFFVETNELSIKVLGTSFDVSSYDDDNTMSYTLEEGAIELINPNGKEVFSLEPGQQATLNRQSRKLLIEDVDTKFTTSWKDGRLIFKETDFGEAVKKLERWFNCNINMSEGLKKSNLKYTATIQDETLVEVLQMIELSTSVKTKLENREVTIW